MQKYVSKVKQNLNFPLFCSLALSKVLYSNHKARAIRHAKMGPRHSAKWHPIWRLQIKISEQSLKLYLDKDWRLEHNITVFKLILVWFLIKDLFRYSKLVYLGLGILDNVRQLMPTNNALNNFSQMLHMSHKGILAVWEV